MSDIVSIHNAMKTFHIISLFPESVESYINASIIGRAREKKLIKINQVALRQFGLGKHKVTDEPPYGGGPGMVLKVEPIYKAVKKVLAKIKKGKTRTILFSTRGKVFTNTDAKRLAKYDNIIFICGRYEGVDERVADHIADEEISIGDFVLSGGELPALVVLDAVSRQIPGVLGKNESLEEIKGSYPVYTKPAEFLIQEKGKKKKSWKVPEVLQSGNHKLIDEWRLKDQK
ncbi:MAG: tRNA (guanine-N1)-methyltransferase [Parcubacteria group bacterium LiPW_41]|nr:MAG: tRNA (guanine-N1)-methyltransferase [Parcubacteria group bacterium LiPW_41]